LRIVHPDAAHPLLALLGAREAGPADLLAVFVSDYTSKMVVATTVNLFLDKSGFLG